VRCSLACARRQHGSNATHGAEDPRAPHIHNDEVYRVTRSRSSRCFRARRDYLASLRADQPFVPVAFGSVAGAEMRPIMGPMHT